MRPFPEVDARTWQVSQGGGAQPQRSRDGRELFYRRTDGLMVARIQTAPAFSRETPRLLFTTERYVFPSSGRSYDVGRDGRFLLMKNEVTNTSRNDSDQQLIFVENWFEELKRLVPTN